MKTGGRKKGTPNKDRQTLLELAKKLNVDPFQVLLMFAGNQYKSLGYKKRDTIHPAVRAKCASEACQYLYAKRKQVEVEAGDVGFSVHHTLDKQIGQDLIEAIKCSLTLTKS